jgi:CDGSH-type Zn-finger protein|tara:strand:+ start:240 stop:428 length:189 start_codon:yes stop_codon:yes gene_type:complete
MEKSKPTIKISENGPLLIKGGATLIYPDGSEEIKEGTVALCRCGLSSKKPFCDGTHKECKSW